MIPRSGIKEIALDRKNFPLLYEKESDKGLSFRIWMDEDRDYNLQKLSKHGSLVFRNIGVDSVDSFQIFSELLCPQLYSSYGDLPECKENRMLYKATPYPNNRTIHFYNEAHTLKNGLLNSAFTVLSLPEKAAH